jgi:hypothetical protein
MRPLRRVPVELRLRLTGKPGTHVHRLPRRDGWIALGGELIACTGIRIFTPDKQQLCENVTLYGQKIQPRSDGVLSHKDF